MLLRYIRGLVTCREACYFELWYPHRKTFGILILSFAACNERRKAIHTQPTQRRRKGVVKTS